MSKADFDGIYTAPDPRPYYCTLQGYGYEIPAHSGTVFGQLAHAFAAGRVPRVVDLCCSYGVNATVLSHDLDFEEVLDHYCDPAIESLGRDELVAVDREWYAGHRSEERVRVAGVDSSRAAIAYASETGLLDAGFAEDLEVSDPSPALAQELLDADLVTVSGGIGYITERTIDRVLTESSPPRLAVLCLRWIDFGPIVDVGAAHGLVTERLDEATYPQRRFSDGKEQRHVEVELSRLGVDPGGREAQGYHHTDLYVLRPEREVAERPLHTLLEPAGAVDERGLCLSAHDRLDVSIFTSSEDLRAPAVSVSRPLPAGD